MMLALVFVAGSAMALNEKNVFGGGLYHYRVTGLGATTGANATVVYNVASGTVATIENATGLTIAAGATADKIINFDVQYGTVAAPASSGKIIVTVTQGSCTNFIEFAITVTTPSMTLNVTASTGGGCQNKNAVPDDNEDASIGATANAVGFTVTAGLSPSGLASYKYDFDITGMDCDLSVDNVAAATTHSDTFTTTEGGGGTVTGTITNGTFTLDAANGGATYPMTVSTDHLDITVNPMPTIGSFSN